MWNAKWLILLLLVVSHWGHAQDTTAPSVEITSPTDQDLVGGKVEVTADADDNVGVTEVKFYKNGSLVKADAPEPFSVQFDFNADAPDQTYNIKVTASDAAGNEQSKTISVRKPKHSFQRPGSTLSNNGAFFKVWAPHANEVALIGDFNQWDRTDHFLWNANGWWFGFEPGVKAGHKYKFAINGTLDRADPYGRQMGHSAAASIVVSQDTFEWTDDAWKTPAFENMIIYELHVGTFVGKKDGQNYPGNFKNFLTKLDYIKSIGANMIEILPVHEVPGPDHPNPTPYLGYAPTGLFAVESSYTSGDAPSYQELKKLVNTAHSKGLGVILDVVYNHFSTNEGHDKPGRDNWYWNYDGDDEGNDGGIYFANQRTPWGIAPDWGRNEVRDYIKQNCRYWLREFHLDGLRWDATTEIKNKGGGWDAMRDIVWSMRQEFPERIMICENLPYESEMVRSGNFHSGWWVDFHHQIERAFKSETSANLDDVRRGINGGDYAHPTNRVIYAMSHDECRNGGSYLISEFGGRNNWYAHAKSRASAALCLLSPGIPMIWQGEEFAQDGWFDDNKNHAVNWKYERDSDGSKMKALYQDATQLRWNSDAIRRGSLTWTHEDNTNKVIAFRRDWGDDHILVVVSFSPTNFTNHSYGVNPGMDGQWTQVLCTQDSRYGGWDGAGNAFYEPHVQDDGKLYINLPKFSIIAMRRK